jgi:riboflavin kinase / FMN adenylyltransferase
MPTHFLHWTETAPEAVARGAISFGNFDGVHKGHARLLQLLTGLALRVQGPAVAITFDPPPVALLRPADLKAPLTTIAERAELLHAAGAHEVIVLKTDASLLALSADAFMEDVILGQLSARAIVEGSNFRFGKDRSGTVAELRALPLLVETLAVDGISSSAVRGHVNTGDMATAALLLGRRYAITGTVVAGAKRGRTIGVPTANLANVPTLVPLGGVYAGHAVVRGERYAAVANVGPNPTFGEAERKIEVHLLAFQGDLYGEALRLEFATRLRDTRTFRGIDELKTQIAADISAAHAALATP